MGCISSEASTNPPATMATFSGATAPSEFSNCYYVTDATFTTAQGKQGYTVAGDNGVTVTLAMQV